MSRALPLAVLAAAVGGVSFGSILVRLAQATPLAISAWRLTLASAVAVPLWLLLGPRRRAGLRTELVATLAGVLLAAHFATWIASLAYTSIAQSVVLVTTAPIWVALFGRLLGLVTVGPRAWAGIALCVAGSTVVALAPGVSAATRASAPSLGNALALAGALCMGGYLLAARAAQRELAFLEFVGRAYAVAAAALWIGVLATGTPAAGYDARTWAALAGLAIVAQLVGHGGANWALRHLGPAFVSAVLVAEPVLASALAWVILDEPVTPAVAAGGALVLVGIVVSARANSPGTT